MAESPELKASLGKLETTLDLYLVKKAPFHLPKNVKELMVKIAPWAILIILLLTLPTVFFVLGLGTVIAPLGALATGAAYAQSLIGLVILIIALVLEAMAIPGLFARTRKGWKLLYYSILVSTLASLANFQFFSGIASAVIGLYLLFQIKEYYK